MSRTGGGKEVLTIAAVGVGMAALGLGLAAFPGAATLGVLGGAAFSSSFARRAKPPLRPTDMRRDEQGRVENWPQVLRAVQQGGVAPELRSELWPLLLGVFSPDSTQAERSAELERLRRLYIKLVLVCRELDEQLAALRSSGSGVSASRASSCAAPVAAVASNGSSDADASGSMAAGAAPRTGSAADLSGVSVRSEAGSASAASAAAPSPPPLPGNLAAFAEAHRIIVMDAVRTDLRRSTAVKSAIGGAAGGSGGGDASPTLTILPVAVGDGLPELMLVSPSEPPPAAASTDAELAEMAGDPGAAAAAGKLPRWCSALAADMLWGATHLDDTTRAQMLRLINLLSAYAVHDPETGYCQGMSDLASIFVLLFEDDALAFACFERLMRAARRNFKHDETGIRHQLQQIARVLRDTDPSLYRKLQQLGAEDCMFAYRMVVVMLRRELAPAACCTLWEMQWAHEAAEAEAAAAAGGCALSSRASCEQQMARTISGGAGESSSNGSSGGGGSSAAAGLRSTVQGLSEATAIARGATARGAAAAQQQQQQAGCPGSGKHSGGAAAAGVAGGAAAGPSSGPGAADDPPEFMLQFIAAVVRAQRGRIMCDCREHDDVLRLFASLDIEFWLAVAQARKQHRAYVGPGASGGGGPAVQRRL